jgi:hypothetical protein
MKQQQAGGSCTMKGFICTKHYQDDHIKKEVGGEFPAVMENLKGENREATYTKVGK